MAKLDPGGFRETTLWMSEEPDQGVIPTDPSYRALSPRLITIEYEGAAPEQVERPAIGESVADLVPGVSEPAITVEYEMARWFYDSDGNPDDLLGYALNREAGRPVSSLLLRHEIKLGDNSAGAYVSPEATLEAREGTAEDPTPKESRRVAVSRGVDVEEGTPTGDKTEGVWAVEASLAAQDVRLYQFDQPRSSQTVEVASTDSSDTDLHVTIEADDGTSETISLDSADATTAAPTSASFDSIANVAVFEDDSGSPGDRSRTHVGNITVTGSSSGELLAILHGMDDHEASYAASGTPILGGGSTEAAPEDVFNPQELIAERPEGEALIPEGDVASVELSIGVDITRSPMDTTARTQPGLVTPELTITFLGETAPMALHDESRRSVAEDTFLYFDPERNYVFPLPRAKITEGGESQSAGETAAESEVTIRAQDMPEPSNAPTSS